MKSKRNKPVKQNQKKRDSVLIADLLSTKLRSKKNTNSFFFCTQCFSLEKNQPEVKGDTGRSLPGTSH